MMTQDIDLYKMIITILSLFHKPKICAVRDTMIAVEEEKELKLRAHIRSHVYRRVVYFVNVHTCATFR